MSRYSGDDPRYAEVYGAKPEQESAGGVSAAESEGEERSVRRRWFRRPHPYLSVVGVVWVLPTMLWSIAWLFADGAGPPMTERDSLALLALYPWGPVLVVVGLVVLVAVAGYRLTAGIGPRRSSGGG